MSLRVLLADESASIRKVFQMGLQDFGAEVKSVHNGLDVIEVAQNYQPDIIFADILLQKKNGYEVSQEVADHNKLSKVPVVLMWSSFMELDQSKFRSCGAQGELEKPFDVENMRNLIKALVGSTRSQKISDFLSFPDSITTEFVEEENTKSQAGTKDRVDKTILIEAEGKPVDFSIDEDAPALSLEPEPEPEPEPEENELTSEFNAQVENDDFNMFEVPQPPPPQPKEETMDTFNDEKWEAKPLNDQTIEKSHATDTDQGLEKFESMNLGNEKKLDLTDFLYQPGTGITPPPPVETSLGSQIQNVSVPQYDDTKVSASAISPDEAESIIRSETRAVLKRTIEEQLPAILEKVVREELEKVLQQEIALKSAGQNLE